MLPANAMSELSNPGLAWLAITIPLISVAITSVLFRVAWQRGCLKKTDIGVLIALVSIPGCCYPDIHIRLVDTIHTTQVSAIAQEIVGCVG